MGCFNSEQKLCFIISPIILYLPFEINLDFSCVVFIQHHKILDAGDRFELPMHLAYETGVVTALPA